MTEQQIRDIAADYRAVFSKWKRAYNSNNNKALGPLEERLELMYDDVGKALLFALVLLDKRSNCSEG